MKNAAAGRLYDMRHLILAALLFAPLAGSAQVDSATKDIRSVLVFMPETALDTAAIRASVELQLWRAGIHIVRPASGDTVDAFLEVLISTVDHERGDTAVATVKLSLSRGLYLRPERGPTRVIGTVWERSYFAANQWPAIKEGLQWDVAQLTNDWTTMNPQLASRR